ncbi:hypothetical protein ColTof4_00449 [Colletotrichum tofieldiae]|nr:hypothetical protein ColTof4_00449 [Colletotrichum tofieldiae]GKT90991.1 hypothetical protein Ct61P_08841 [Colletotrichum tofieldiae]
MVGGTCDSRRAHPLSGSFYPLERPADTAKHPRSAAVNGERKGNPWLSRILYMASNFSPKKP